MSKKSLEGLRKTFREKTFSVSSQPDTSMKNSLMPVQGIIKFR